MENSARNMKALVLEQFGAPYILKEIGIPTVDDYQVLVQIKASGINPLDLKIKSGNAGHAKVKLPAIPGVDMAGIVVKVGRNVENFKAGDEVYGLTGGIGGVQGSLAEYASVDPDLLAIKPKNLTMKEAASLPLAFITAWEGLVDRAKVGTAQSVLIHGGAGGVGHIAIQIAKSFGAQVFATGSESQKSILNKLGATAIDYQTETVSDYVDNHTKGEGFDIIFDTLGGTTLDASFQAVKVYTGHVVSILGWGSHSLAPLSFRGATYSGVFTLLPLLSGKGRKHHGEILKEATRLAENGLLKPTLDPKTFTLETIEVAYQAIENRTTSGKVVIEI
ncbi:zinc-dependent alcohol dehydrogenase family protein [Dyadobacter frigoris]|uniref:Zinc-dependent alcohol dehydrogenase family protein n=1 Tax=Dyadobacter frigoris TaxID=2576211 RepID=A0A4U6D7W1_9BACT|nr:zinc-dependent alcohol dehydrogenase family protein [Dyadobacter frigoris]TKT93512.1 zinc-dependent alcohol dehydrogenase family protein [Dyadobacter frigoris]GLU55756.1 quinone oxidoreductase [Dyadobacter frigoris]